MRPTGPQRQAASCRADQRGVESEQGQCRPVSWLLRKIVVLIRGLALDALPGQGFQLLPCPGAVIVLLVLKPFVFIDTEQDKGLFRMGIHYARRSIVSIF